jgi:8-oxo-dGTP pyrophosphatase MutT (NUDIX family)
MAEVDLGPVSDQARGKTGSITKLPRQAAAIAVRRQDGRLEVCLIRRKESRKWGIPKGMVDPGDTPEETALKEAWEEAGLKGRLVGGAIGSFEYEKWSITRYAVTVYLMEVLEQATDWHEAPYRERRWASFDEAASLLKDHPVRALLDRAKDLL